MTRGSFYIVLDDMIVETIEFNGDMYPTGHGKHAIEMLERVNNLQQFTVELNKFDRENYNYKEKLYYPQERQVFMKKENVIDMSKNYYELFFSDWTFWKNLSKKTVTFKTDDKKTITLEPKEQIAIYFGRYDRHYKNSEVCQKLIEAEEKTYA